MKYKLKEAPGEPVVKSKCRHYWVIEGARGPISRGVCKFCGAEREFYNSWSDLTHAERNARVFEFPDLLGTEPDEEQKDSEPEESNANL